MSDDDFFYMGRALTQARNALLGGEVPVGALVVRDGVVLAEGFNSVIACSDPTAHAELCVLRAAGQTIKNYRLNDCTLYVTLEPCPMCWGAIEHARIKRVVFGAYDTQGAWSIRDEVLPVDRQRSASCAPRFQKWVIGGCREEECASLLAHFFASRRLEQKREKTPLREDAIRADPQSRERIPRELWPAVGFYTSALPSLQGLRLHYWTYAGKNGVPENSGTNTATLCLHGPHFWAFQFSPFFLHRHCEGTYYLLDRPGHGWSDKTKHGEEHDLQFQTAVVNEFITNSPDVKNWNLVACEGAAHLALSMAYLLNNINKITLINPKPYPCNNGTSQSEVHAEDKKNAHQNESHSMASQRKYFVRQYGDNKAAIYAALLPYEDIGHIKGWMRYMRARNHSKEQIDASPRTPLTQTDVDVYCHAAQKKPVINFIENYSIKYKIHIYESFSEISI